MFAPILAAILCTLFSGVFFISFSYSNSVTAGVFFILGMLASVTSIIMWVLAYIWSNSNDYKKMLIARRDEVLDKQAAMSSKWVAANARRDLHSRMEINSIYFELKRLSRRLNSLNRRIRNIEYKQYGC